MECGNEELKEMKNIVGNFEKLHSGEVARVIENFVGDEGNIIGNNEGTRESRRVATPMAAIMGTSVRKLCGPTAFTHSLWGNWALLEGNQCNGTKAMIK